MRTSLYTILCIVIRLAAVFLAVQTVMTIVPTVWSMDDTQLGAGWRGTLLGFGGAMVALSALLWIYPGTLARIAAGRASQQVFESPLSGTELQQIALSVIGVWFAMSGIIGLASVGMRLILDLHVENSGAAPLAYRELARIATQLFEIALGCGLALGARGLVGILRRVREEGLPAAAPEERSGEQPEPNS